MNRSPLFYPMNRLDTEAGGSADLQTDVMRFMAIISMCLVAIFALVQSIPLAPRPVVEENSKPALNDETVAKPDSDPEAETTIELTRPQPVKIERKPVETVALERPRLKPIERRQIPPVTPRNAIETPVDHIPGSPIDRDAADESVTASPQAQSPTNASKPVSTPSKAQKGFTLRFESDDALTRLVARDVVDLYALAPGNTRRMTIENGEMSFWSASAPERFHEMDVATVPARVLTAYRRTNPGAGAQWGVSIPATMSRQLNQYLAEHEGGSLIIRRDGSLRLEP